MLRYVKNKLINNVWMAVSLLIGNLLLISIAACSPMYSRASLQRMLQRNLETAMEETGLYPGSVEFRASYATQGSSQNTMEKVEALREVAADFAANSPSPVLLTIDEYFRLDISTGHEADPENIDTNFSARLEAISDFSDHITLITGSLPSKEVKDGILEAVVNQKTLMENNLYVGEVLLLRRVTNAAGEAYRVRVTGVFAAKDEKDPYWFFDPGQVGNFLFVQPEAFRSALVEQEGSLQPFQETFYVTLDVAKMEGEKAAELIAYCDRTLERSNTIYNNVMNARFYETLTAYIRAAARLETTLLVLQVPIYLLLIAFIWMVSGQMLAMDQNEIAMIKSRGASRRQIVTIYFLQGLILTGIAFVLALPLGYFLCQMVGSANAFLEFVQRRALSVKITGAVFAYAGGAALLCILTMVIPALSYARVGIVDFKRAKHVKKKPFWQRFFLDFLLMAVALYGLYSYRRQMSFLSAQLSEGAALDPLLYLCSSLFILAAAMIFVRVFPLLIKLIFSLFKKKWSPGLYASFLRMLRTQGNQNFIMIFLVITLSMGVFSAQTARTINSNAEENIRYQSGADIVLQESWKSRQYAGMSGETERIYTEPDYTKYRNLEGAKSYTKVYVNRGARISLGTSTLTDIHLMGISTKEFGETAYLKDGLVNTHWYRYLNAMSQDAEGVLMSMDFRDKLGLKLGDRISYQVGQKGIVRGVIYGFIDYFPGCLPPNAAAEGSYFIIANLTHLQSKWGIEPYQIWIRSQGESSSYIYDFAERYSLTFSHFEDTRSKITLLKNDPVFQATNGVLTVGFIVVLLLCSVGFLIYWILSIQSRQLQFGIFRAMGMSMREILSMLLSEQFFLSVLSIVVGALVGKAASTLYVPLIQMAYRTEGQWIPLSVSSALTDELRLYVVVAAVMILCLLLLGRLIRRIKIAQALKLGED